MQTYKLVEKSKNKTFSVNGCRFYQFLTQDKIIHFEYLSRKNKEEIRDLVRKAKENDIEEVFTVDQKKNGDLLNANGKIVGTLIHNGQENTFVSVLTQDETLLLKCDSESSYDCYSEVIQWLFEKELFEYFRNHK